MRAEKSSKYSYDHDLMKFDKTIIPFALVGYKIGYCQLSTMRFVGYLTISHQTRAQGTTVKYTLWRYNTCFRNELKEVNKVFLIMTIFC